MLCGHVLKLKNKGDVSGPKEIVWKQERKRSGNNVYLASVLNMAVYVHGDMMREVCRGRM